MEPINNDEACYNLLAAIVDQAVYDFNCGNNEANQMSAASFFRGKRFKWICNSIGVEVTDIVKARLNGDPFGDPKLFPKTKRKKISTGRAVPITWNGETRTIEEWAILKGFQVATLRTRIVKHGVCDYVFQPSNREKRAKKITWKGQTKTITEWAAHYNLKNDTLRARISKHGVCEKVFKQNMPPLIKKTKNHKVLKVTWNGKTKTMKEWARIIGITHSGMHNRFQKYGLTKRTFTPVLKKTY